MMLIMALICIAALLATAVLAVAGGRSPAILRLVYGLSLACTVLLFGIAITHLLTVAAPVTATLPLGLPWIGAHFRLDALGAFFLVVVNLGAAAASLYALGYGRHEQAPQRVLPFYPAFLAGMNLVVLADDAFTFLLSWEFMSLVVLGAGHGAPPRARTTRSAGYVYLVMASFGTLALLLAFGLLAGPDGGYAFAPIRAAPAIAAASPRSCWSSSLIGAGSKAGLVPLHVWLPLAHPAAPSHVSALMSGVMTKVAVYGFVRIVFDLLGAPAWWWSVVVLALGGDHLRPGRALRADAARPQAAARLHTVENIGIIFIGLGLALAFQANGMACGGGAGADRRRCSTCSTTRSSRACCSSAPAPCSTATGERDMEQLGGLIHRMPLTAFAFLVGCVAISALPPLNGFVSEWLTFQAILLSPELPPWGLKFLVPAVGALLALSAALAAACFVKAFGITFLGRPRTAGGASGARRSTASRSPRCSPSPRSACSPASCPGSVIDALGAGDGEHWSAAACRCRPASPWLSIVPIAESRSSYNGLLVFVVHRGLGARSPRFAIHRLASRQAAPRARPGTAAFPIPVRRRNTPPSASRSRSAACSARSCSARARTSRCRRPATCGRRGSPSSCAISSGTRSTRRSPAASTSPPTGSTVCSS